MRLAVVSPFLDRSHGTERCIVEQIERLARKDGWEIHLYCQHVAHVAGVRTHDSAGDVAGTGIYWHKIPGIPGPHLLKYVWWFAANHLWRWRDRRSGAVKPDLVYSPGINCLDADAIVVHIVFHEFYRRVKSEIRLSATPARSWPRIIHRKLYYHLIMTLERAIYRRSGVALAAVSRLASRQLAMHFQRTDVAIVPNAVDTGRMYSSARIQKRPEARKRFGFADADFVLLLIGNDWKIKGLDGLLEAVAACNDATLKLLVVGRDDRSAYMPRVAQLGLHGRVVFAGPASDVLPFYAAADTYAGPSLEDSFGLPVLEAMACGLPAISSSQSGVSEVITDGIDGFILDDPSDRTGLARFIRLLQEQPGLRQRMGHAAAQTAQQYNWDRNAAETREFLLRTLVNKNSKK